MAHNFKLTGDYYVSVDGSDSNNGLTKDTPKRTVQAGLNLITAGTKALVIGAGVYAETISRTIGGNNLSITILCDGYVVLEGISSTSSFFMNVGSGGPANSVTTNSVVGSGVLEVRKYISFTLTTGWDFNFTGILYNIIFKEIPTVSIYFTTIRNSIFINSLVTSAYSARAYCNKCIFINSTIIPTQLLNCFISQSSSIVPNTILSAANFNYNNIQGTIIMNTATGVTSGTYQDVQGRYYNLAITTSTGTGTIGDPFGRPLTNGAGFNFTTHRILYPTFNANSFSQDPKFNNIQAQDFTLQAASPHLGKASDSTNIGGTSYAIRDSAKGDVYNASAVSVANLIFNGNDYIISGSTTGEVISAPRFINAPSPKLIQLIRYNGLFEFNKAITPPATGNRNVPDQETYKSTVQPPDVQGGNPDRLVFYLRYSTQIPEPTIDAEWDNNALWTAGNYEAFEWNTKPSVDLAGKGNGAPTFNNADTPTFINACWIQMKVKLRDDYV